MVIAHRRVQLRLAKARLPGRGWQRRELRKQDLRNRESRNRELWNREPRSRARTSPEPRICEPRWNFEPRSSKLRKPALRNPELRSPGLRSPELWKPELRSPRLPSLELWRRELRNAGPHREPRHRRRPVSLSRPQKGTLRDRKLRRSLSVRTSGASPAGPPPRQARAAGRLWKADPAQRLRRPQPRGRSRRRRCEPGPITLRRNCTIRFIRPTRLSSRRMTSSRPWRLRLTTITLARRQPSRGSGQCLPRGADSRPNGPGPSELAAGLI